MHVCILYADTLQMQGKYSKEMRIRKRMELIYLWMSIIVHPNVHENWFSMEPKGANFHNQRHQHTEYKIIAFEECNSIRLKDTCRVVHHKYIDFSIHGYCFVAV